MVFQQTGVNKKAHIKLNFHIRTFQNDQFPVFEAYATIDDGAGLTLFREKPPVGNTVMNLPQSANRPTIKTIYFP